MTGKRTPQPSYLTDPDDNRFLVSLLTEKGFAEDDSNIYARRANTAVALFIEQTKAFFPEQYTGGDGGNVKSLPEAREGWAS